MTPEPGYEKRVKFFRAYLTEICLIALCGVVIFLFKAYDQTQAVRIKAAEDNALFWRDAYLKSNQDFINLKKIETFNSNINRNEPADIDGGN